MLAASGTQSAAQAILVVLGLLALLALVWGILRFIAALFQSFLDDPRPYLMVFGAVLAVVTLVVAALQDSLVVAVIFGTGIATLMTICFILSEL